MNGGPESGGGEREREARASEPEVSDADYEAAVGPPPERPHAVGHVASLGLYLLVYAGLLVLTALTVLVSFVHLGVLNAAAAVVIAVVKALLVALFFMHVRWSTRLVGVCVVTGLFFVVHMMGGTLQDYFSRGLLGVPGK